MVRKSQWGDDPLYDKVFVIMVLFFILSSTVGPQILRFLTGDLLKERTYVYSEPELTTAALVKQFSDQSVEAIDLPQFVERRRYQWDLGRHGWDVEFSLLKEWIENAQVEIEVTNIAARRADREAQRLGFSGISPEISFWSQAYKKIAQQNIERTAHIAAIFRSFQLRHSLSDIELQSAILAFVQSFEYRIPANTLGIYTPPTALNEYAGDCDTTALLLVLLYRNLGYDAVILVSTHYKHAMVGLSTQASGTAVSYKGRMYYVIETTNKGWRIGQMPPTTNQLEHWIVVTDLI